MFASKPNYLKLRTNLRLCINRLKLLEKKKTELALKARREIADYILAGKDDRARIRVEHIIREDYLVEAMEIVEMLCDLLLARFGLIEKMSELDPGIEEAVATLIWVAPRLSGDVQEMREVAHQLTIKYGKEFGEMCRRNTFESVNEKVVHKMSLAAPPKMLVEHYMIEIARTYKVPFEPDPLVMMGEPPEASNLIDLGIDALSATSGIGTGSSGSTAAQMKAMEAGRAAGGRGGGGGPGGQPLPSIPGSVGSLGLVYGSGSGGGSSGGFQPGGSNNGFPGAGGGGFHPGGSNNGFPGPGAGSGGFHPGGSNNGFPGAGGGGFHPGGSNNGFPGPGGGGGGGFGYCQPGGGNTSGAGFGYSSSGGTSVGASGAFGTTAGGINSGTGGGYVSSGQGVAGSGAFGGSGGVSSSSCSDGNPLYENIAGGGGAAGGSKGFAGGMGSAGGNSKTPGGSDANYSGALVGGVPVLPSEGQFPPPVPDGYRPPSGILPSSSHPSHPTDSADIPRTGPGTAGRAPMNPQMSWINDDYLPSLPPYEQVVSSPNQYPTVQPGQRQPSSGADGSDINRLPDIPNFPDVPGLPSVPSNSLGGASVGGDDVDFDDLARRFEELKRRK